MRSHVFDLTEIELGGTREQVLIGGRQLFPLLPAAFAGVRRIAVIGWGSQARAQAMNLRDSLGETEIAVTVGLRAGSPSWELARESGFTEDDGSLGEIPDVLANADLALFLIADAALAEHHDAFFAAMRPGATIGLSHGFLFAHLVSRGRDFPDDFSVIAVCPKGMGPSLRRLYEQGRDASGAGINASVAVHRDLHGRATDQALGWAVAIGSPYVFETTLDDELRSDIAGERAVLLSAPHAIAEAVFRRSVENGDSPRQAFLRSTESMTGPLAKLISRGGLRAVIDAFDGDARRSFEDAYCAAYPVAARLVAEIYEEVASGNEIVSVELACRRLESHPMPAIDGSRMWAVGKDVRAERDGWDVPVDPLVAGLFCAAMMAQVDHFATQGHRWSEIANESIIEAVDSLIPYMHSRGVAYMVDNCSTTARLGARKWAPRWEAGMTQEVFPALDGVGRRDQALIDDFHGHSIHDVLAAISAYRPAVDISVP